MFNIDVMSFIVQLLVILCGVLTFLIGFSYRYGKRQEAESARLEGLISTEVGDVAGALHKRIEQVDAAARTRNADMKHTVGNLRTIVKAIEVKLQALPTQEDFRAISEVLARQSEAIANLDKNMDLIRESLMRERETQNKMIVEKTLGGGRGASA